MARKITPLTITQAVAKIQRAIDKGELRDVRYDVNGNMVTLRHDRGRYGKISPEAQAIATWALDKLAPHLHDQKSAQVGGVRPEKGVGNVRYDRTFTCLHMDEKSHGVRVYVDLFAVHQHGKLTAYSDQLDRKGRPKWFCNGCGQAATLAEQRERGLL